MKLREADWLALLLILVCALLGVSSHNALNPDGVSYLDLAARLRDGDWQHFVQGYWSPLYPAIIAIGGSLTGREGPALIGLVHLVDTGIAILGVGVIWWAARRSNNLVFGRSAFAAYLLCSAQAPRLEAVTPDLLLVAFIAMIGCELLFFAGRNWWRLGLWMGLAFLVKTSMWPWLLAAVLIRLLASRDRAEVGRVLKSSAICAAILLLWLVPLARRSGGATLGSAARLNACWYMRECDSRSPDTHTGVHRLYQEITVGSSHATVATIGGTPWTYLPWGDPTEWAAGVITARRVTPTLGQHLLYSAKELVLVLGVWMPHIWLGVLLPVAWIYRRRGSWRELGRERRDAGVVMLLGLIGLLQFIPVHVEPRLVAPFVLLFTLGTLSWLCATTTALNGPLPFAERSGKWLLLLSWLGLVTALPRSILHAREQWETATLTEQRRSMIVTAEAARLPPRSGDRRIGVIGEVFPLLTEAYRLGGKIELQVLRPTVPEILAWPPEDQQALAGWLASQGVTEAWLSKPGGSFSIIPLSAR